MDMSEYIHFPWAALRRNKDKAIFYLSKEKTYLNKIDHSSFSPGDWGEFFIADHILYVLHSHRVYYLNEGKWIDVYSLKNHAINLNKGSQISFGHIEYTYLPKAPFQIKELSNTFWDENFLQHLLHQFKFKTKFENSRLHFWKLTPHKRKVDEFRKLCYDTKKTYKLGQYKIAQEIQLPLFCQDYYQSIIPAKISFLPSVLIAIISELSQDKISVYGTVILCNKYSEFLSDTDRIVLHHNSKRNFELSKNILKQNQILLKFTDRKLKIKYAMSLPGKYYYFRMGGKQLRHFAFRYQKLDKYFEGPNYALIKRESKESETKKLLRNSK